MMESNLALKELTVSASITYCGNSFHAFTTLLLKKFFLVFRQKLLLTILYVCPLTLESTDNLKNKL